MTSARPALSYTLEGLAEREATLFKSFVRLIDHRTQHHWSWREASADLLVRPDGGADALPAGRPVLRVGRDPCQAPDYLCLPFRAADLEDRLNALGARLMAARGVALPREHAAAATSAPHTQPQSQAIDAAVVQLLRWPPPHLLTTTRQVRLATLMTGRPTSLAQLSQRSGQPAEVCEAFLRRLDQAGLLRAVAAATTPARSTGTASRSEAPAPGLLARIRNRLGLLAGARA